MTSKTFKSEHGRSLTIDPSDGHNIGLATAGSFLALKIEDAPALALAILEAAGFDDVDSGNISCAVAELRAYIERQERITAEAQAQAELEAEALELYKAAHDALGLTKFTAFHMLTESQKVQWLAVARRARELAKEATK